METKDELAIPYEDARKISSDFYSPIVWTHMKGMAEAFRMSGGLPKGLDTVPKIMLVMQAGREMGMAPVEATQDLYPVNGAVNIWGKAITKRLRKFGWEIDYEDEIREKDKESVTAVVWKWIKDPNTGKFEKRVHRDTQTFQMAKDSGHTEGNKPGWKPGSNRLDKLRYGALNRIIKTRLADVLGTAQGIQEVEEDIIRELPVVDNVGNSADNNPAPPQITKGTATDVTAFLKKAKEEKEKKNPPELKMVKKDNGDIKSDTPQEQENVANDVEVNTDTLPDGGKAVS